MPDHLARAQELRHRAAKCQISAKETLSEKFGDCYRLLSQALYIILGHLEEDFVSRQIAASRNDLIAR